MRSLVCCGVSRTACARLGGARTSIPSRAFVTKHHVNAPRLAGCMRMNDPRVDYTSRTEMSIKDLHGVGEVVPGRGLGVVLARQVCYQISQQKEEQKICGNVQVEVHHAMGEKADAADEAGEVQGGCKRCIGTQNPAGGIKQQHTEKPRAAQAARYASLRQRFEVVVVGVIDELAVIEGFVGRENGLERAKTRACPRMIEENAPGVRAHGGALPGGHLERLQRGKSLKDFIRAEPGDQ